MSSGNFLPTDGVNSDQLTALVTELEEILRQLLNGQRSLHTQLERKQQALRKADIQAVAAICQQEQALIRRIGQLESQRQELNSRMTQMVDPAAKQPWTVNDLAQLLDESDQKRLLVLAAELREALNTNRTQSSILHKAAEALARHMSGIAQTVHMAMSRARVYGAKGTIASGAQLDFTVDLQT